MNMFYAEFSGLWELNHKISVDVENKLIYVSPYVTTLDIKTELYSDYKEWYKLRDNSGKGEVAMRSVGGDPTTGNEIAGDLYFMINNWRVVYDPTKVKVTGILFSDDYDTPWLNAKDLQSVYPATVANLATGVTGLATANDIPSSSENATEVWNSLAGEFSTPGSFGEFVQKLLTVGKFLGLK